MDTFVFNYEFVQFAVVNACRGVQQTFQASSDEVEPLGEESHAGHVKQIESIKAVKIRKDGMLHVEYVKGL